jgi:hypothetical protein
MRRFRPVSIVGAVLFATAFLIHCSEKDKGADPGPRVVELRGTVSFPTGTPVILSDLTVGFADTDNAIDSTGWVAFTGTEHVPGLGMVMDQSGSTLLMGIVSDPLEKKICQFDARSTAEALVFMNPFVCETTRDKAVQTMTDLDALPQIDTLEILLLQKLSIDPKCLEKVDAQLAGIITRSINAYISMHEESSASPSIGSGNTRGKPAVSSTTASSILISPTTQTSGHLVTHAGDNTFNITNAYGRWALLVVPQTGKQIFLSPNGSMLDFWKDGLPWAPSNTTFNLVVDQPDDTQKVFVYGYGLKNDAESYWETLTAEEQRYADKAGCLTFVFELIGGVVDVACATNSALSGVDGWEKECENTESEMWLLDFMLNDAWDASQIHTMAKEGKYGDLAWFVFKTVFEKITTDETYRLRVESIMKSKFSEKQLKRMDWLASNPATYAIGAGINIGNKVTNVMKTAYGIRDARFKTVFKIWKSNEDFGGITGHVMRKESPFGPIAGANVHLSGDDNNPIPGHVTDVVTDADGGFMFANIQVGAKSLTATKAGYNDKSVSVTVAKNQVANVTIEMSKKVGTIKGIVVNEIYSKARSMPQDLPQYANLDTLFNSQLFIYARGNVAGQPFEDSKTIYNGRYTFDLPVGTFWIVAIHPDNDYTPDSMQVTSVENEIHDAPRALRMSPKGTMSVEFYIDASSTANNYNLQIVGASWPVTDNGKSMLGIAGGTKDQQEFDFFTNMARVTGPGSYPIGPGGGIAAPTWNYAGFAAYLTALLKCQHEGSSYSTQFMVVGDPNERPCDCGITDYGTLYVTQWGTDLGDVIEGALDCRLAGYKNCECEGIDDNHDGTIDRWDVSCQVLYFKDVKFRMAVGSLLITRLPSAPLKPESGQPLLFAPDEIETLR